MKQLKAYHVFTQYKPITFLGVNLLVQLASALHWKRLHGSIGLICNEPYYRLLERFPGFLEIYDTVDYASLSEIPNQELWWASAKILSNKFIPEDEYVILDTDLITLEPFTPLAEEFAWCGFHKEYPGPQCYHPLSRITSDPALLRSDVNPVNTAFLYVKDKPLILDWVSKAEEIMGSLVPEDGENKRIFMTSVEQWLLPILTESSGKSFTTLISNVADTSRTYKGLSPQWDPNPYDRLVRNKGNVLSVLKYMKHIWGSKSPYDEVTIKYLISSISEDMNIYFKDHMSLVLELTKCIYEKGCELNQEL